MKRIALILILMMPSSAWAENYLCIGEQATGFYFSNNKWNDSRFSDEKYLVKIEDNLPTVSIFGRKNPIFSNSECTFIASHVICSALAGQFKMRTDNLRFLYTYTFGYVENAEQGNTPLIRLGTCSEF